MTASLQEYTYTATRTPWYRAGWCWCILATLVARATVVRAGSAADPDAVATLHEIARAIQAGDHFPLMWWGRYHMSVLTAYVCAPLIATFGESAWWWRLAMLPWAAAQVGICYLLGRTLMSPRIGLLAGWLVACSAVTFQRWSMQPAVGEALALSWLALWVALAACRGTTEGQIRQRWWGCGMIAGIAIYMHPLAVSAACAILTLVMLRPAESGPGARWRFLMGCGLGLLPLIAHSARASIAMVTNVEHVEAAALVAEGARWILVLGTQMVHSAPLAVAGLLAAPRLLQEVVSAGAQPGAVYAIAGGFVTLAFAAATISLFKRARRRLVSHERLLMLVFMVWTVVVYLLSHEWSSQWLLPLVVVPNIALAAWVVRAWTCLGWQRLMAGCVIISVLSWNLWTIRSLAWL